MGQVYRATDTKLGRDVALKVLPVELAADPERLARFQREARAVAALNHPHIVTIFSVEEADGIHFFTMELVEGQALDKLIPEGSFTLEQIMEIAGALADALSAAHEKGIMHRDLKPANVMLTSEGRVKVLDFGLAKETRPELTENTLSVAGRTQAGVVMGTPAYMSPEQVIGRSLDHRTDIFSLGVMLHEMATGQRPFAGNSSAELSSAILRDTPPPVTDLRADLPADLARIIRRCLEKDPRHRVQTARDVANEFRDLARQSSGKRPAATSSSVRASAAADSGAARADEGFWVAVLPFKYAGGNADLKALAEGLTDDIATGMSRFSYLRVIARSSTARYAQQAVDVRAAARELGARYVMEGSIRQAGAKIRLAVQLVDANTGAGLWAETYDRAFNAEAMLDLLDDVVPRIVVTVGDTQGILAHSMTEALRNRDPESLTPYEALLRSFGFHQQVSAAEHMVGRTALERAIQQAPDRADCWAMLSWLYRSEYSHGFNERPDSLQRALDAARRAVELAPSNQFAHAALASALYFRREFAASRAAAERAIALNKEGYATAFLGLMLAYAGDWERGCALAERSTQLNPNHPGWYWLPLIFNEYRLGNGRRALELALRLNMPGFWFNCLALALTYSQVGEIEKAQSALRELLAVRPSFRTNTRQELEKWWQPELVEQMLTDLQKAGLDLSGAAPAAESGSAPARKASGETRTDEGFWVAVLPFKYTGSNADLKALAEGLPEEVITGLSRFSYLRVIGRGSTAKYSSESGDVRRIGKELGARYVMEGSLRQAGAKLRLAAQLVDTNTGAHLWAETFERSFTPETIFELQDDLVPRIVSTVADMNGVLPRSMGESLRGRAPEQLSPYEAVLRSFSYCYSATPEALTAARSGVEAAVRKDPAYADGWAMLSFLCGQDYVHGYNLQANALETAASAARSAVELGPTNHLAYFSLASVLWYQKDFDSFRDAVERAVALNPMDGNSVAYLGELLTYAGDHERGMQLAGRAKQLNPNHPGWYWYADFYESFHRGDYRGALSFALKAKMRGNPLAPMMVAAACGQLGDVEGGVKAVADLVKFRPELPALMRKQVAKVWTAEYGERFLDGLSKAGLDIREVEAAASGEVPISSSRSSDQRDSGATRTDEGFWVAVLPFKYSGNNAELRALADGLTDDILTGFSKFSFLRVIARSSTARYAQQAVDVRTVAKELGARYVLEGSIRPAGTKVRIAVQLVDASSGAGLWAETYDRPMQPDATLELLDEVVPRIVCTVADTQGVLAHSMTEALRNRDPETLTPYEAVLRSFGHHQRISAAEHLASRTALERAVKQPPDRADCWAALAWLYREEYTHAFNAQPHPLERALAASRRALDAGPSNHLAQAALASTLFFLHDMPGFRAAAERAIALNPMEGYNLGYLGMLIAYGGDWERGCALADRAMQLNPNHPGWYWFPRAFNAYRQRDYRGAVETILKVNLPGFWRTQLMLAAANGQLGERVAAGTAVQELLKIRPSFAGNPREELKKWHDQEMIDHLVEGLCKAGLEIPAAGASETEGHAASAAPTDTAPSNAVKTSVQTASGAAVTQAFWVAVLPLTHPGKDAEMESFAEGLAEDIIAGLAKFPYLSVISRNSTLRFKGQTGDVRAVGRELGARYLLEGGIRKGTSSLRVNMQLIDTQSGAHLWAETYNRDLKNADILAIQDDITDHVVATVADSYGALVRSMAASVAEKPEAEMTASDWVLRHYRYRQFISPDEHAPVRDGLERFVEREPKHAAVWAALAQMYVHEFCLGYNQRPRPLERALDAARRAIHLDLTCQHGRSMLAFVHFFRRDSSAFRSTAEQAMEMNPRDTDTVGAMGLLLMYAGEFERGAKLVRRAMDLNPQHADWMHFALMWEHFHRGDYEAALVQVTRMSMPGLYWQPLSIAACCGLLGRKAEAAVAVQELLKLDKDFEQHARESIDRWLQLSGLQERFFEGLRLAGLRIPEAGEAPPVPFPIDAASSLSTGSAAAAAKQSSGATRAQEGFWVAVLPFKVAAPEPELDALASALTEEVTAGLSRFPYLQVVAHNSAMAFKGRSGDIRAVGRELGARYVLEGSIRKGGRAVRVNAQLVDASSGTQLWAETYNREPGDGGPFEILDDLTDRIVTTVADGYGVLVRSMASAVGDKPVEQASASELVLRYFAYMQQISPEEHARLRAGFEQAVEREPRHANAWACLGFLYCTEYLDRFNPRERPMERARDAAMRAVSLDPACQMGWEQLAAAHYFVRDFGAFRPAAERAISLNPRNGSSCALMAMLLAYSGEWERGVALTEKIMARNPHHPGWYYGTPFMDYYRKGEYEEALQAAKKINMPEFHWSHLQVAAACGQLNRLEEARAAIESLRKHSPAFLDVNVCREDIAKWIQDPALLDQLVQGWRKAGLKEFTDKAEPGPATSLGKTSSGALRAQEGFWVAVLPFKSRGEAGLEAVAEGFTEEIITGLSRFSYLRVIARGSTAKYSGESRDIPAIGKELGARYVMEGSIRQAGATARVAVQLVDATTGAHLWAETFERPFRAEQVFALQDDLVPRIVSTIADAYGVLPRTMSQAVRRKNRAELTPYEALLRSFSYAERVTIEEHAEAKAALEQAVQQAPASSDCWAMLSTLLCDEFIHGFSGAPDLLERALHAARRAVDTGTSNHKAHQALAWALFFRKETQASRNAAERTLALNPMDACATAYMGLTIAFSGDWERGCALVRRAIELNPNHPGWYWYAPFLDAYRKDDFRGALAIAHKISMPGFPLGHVALAAAYGQLGELAAGQAAVRELLALKPDYAAVARQELAKVWPASLVEQLIDGLRKAGLDVSTDPRAAATGEGSSASAARHSSGAMRAQEGFWVAVLPFKSRGEAGLEAVAEGFTEEIITGLSRFSYLRVIARGSTAKYSGESRDIPAIGKELGARYVMEGSIRQAGTAARIAVQLVDATTGTHLWAETFERPFRAEQAFALQDELVPRIVSTVADQHGVLVRNIRAAIRTKVDAETGPYEAIFRVFSMHERMTAAEHAAVRDLLERAVKEAPNEGDCWAMLATLYSDEDWFGFNLRPDPLGRAAAAAARAVELAPASALASQALAQSLFMRREWRAFRPVAERTIALNPMDGAIVAIMGILLACSGEWERGCAVADSAMKLHPNFPGWYWLAAIFNAYRTRDYRATVDAALRIQMPEYFWTYIALAAAYGQLGEMKEAQKAVKELRTLRPEFAMEARRALDKWFEPELAEHFMDGLRKAGLEIPPVEDVETGQPPKEAAPASSAPSKGPKTTTAIGSLRTPSQAFWIAVLPFTHAGGDAELEACAEGLAEDINAGLAKFPYLSVLSRGPAPDARGPVADARYRLEGRIRKSGAALRINVQLIDTQNGVHLWAETYNRDLKKSEMFTVQDDLTDRVVATVADAHGVLVRSMVASILEKPEAELTAADWVLRHFHYVQHISPELHLAVRDGLEQFVQREPRNAALLACLAKMYVDEYCFGFNSGPDALDRALAAARRSVDLDRSSQYAAQVFAQVHFFRRDLPAFRNAAEQAVAMNPRSTDTLAQIGLHYVHIREFEHGVSLARRAMELNPHHPGFYHVPLIWDYFHQADYPKALEEVKRANLPGMFWQHLFTAAACGHLGRTEEAAEAARELHKLNKDFEQHARPLIERFHYSSGMMDSILEGLAKAGLHVAEEQKAAASGVFAAAPSIAVLPFANLSADPEQDYFSDGLAEEIINLLAQIPGLKVIARTSAFAFRGKEQDIRGIAEALGVGTVLEGSVRRAGSRIRVTAQLIKAADGSHIWSERYDRELSDIFAVQDEISAAIAKTLRLKLSGEAAPQRYTPKLPAYEAFLRAKHHEAKVTPEAMELARQCYEQACQLDRAFAMPHVGLGSYWFALTHFGRHPAQECIPAARAEIQSALQIDPSLPEAHALLGHIAATCDSDWAAAEKHFAFPKAKEASYWLVRPLYGWFLFLRGDAEQAIQLAKRAIEDDPLEVWAHMNLHAYLQGAGRTDEALEQLIKVIELDPNQVVALVSMVMIYADKGDLAKALELARRAYAIAPWYPDAIGLFAGLTRRSGGEVEPALAKALGSGEAVGDARAHALYHLLCGEIDEGADWTEKAVEQQDSSMTLYLRFVVSKGLRASKRWPKIAKTVHIPA